MNMHSRIPTNEKKRRLTKSDPTPLQALDLFCGAGGLTVGLTKAGFDVVAAVELNPTAAETYRKNHPSVRCIEKNIAEVDAEQLRTELRLRKGELALLAGCPPCQGFSTLRTRKKSTSVKDARNDLLFDFLRFVEAFEPKAVMMENVPALARDKRMRRLLARLSELGYCIDEDSVRIEDASEYGVPQRRKRMILQVAKNQKIPKARRSKPKTVRDTLQKISLRPVGESGDPLHDHTPKYSARVAAVIKAIPKNGGSRASLPEHLVLPCHKKNPNGFLDVYGRMKWDDVAPTMTGGCGNPSKGRFIHPSEDRAITLREAACFQTFPRNYWFSNSSGRDGIALMIGNALPPEFIRRHALVIAKTIRSD